MEKKNWFDRLFSLDEMKTSSLVISLFSCLAFGIFLCLEKGDIPPNLAMVILALIGAIGGVSAFNLMSNRTSMQSQYSQYGTNGINSYQSNSYMNNSMGMNPTNGNSVMPVLPTSTIAEPLGQVHLGTQQTISSTTTNMQRPI